MNNYILINGIPTLEPDTLKWAKWFENSLDERIVKQDYIDNILISTVFLGVDYNFDSPRIPILYETMIFGGELRGESMWRYPTAVKALIGHNKVLREFEIFYKQEKYEDSIKS